MENFTFCAVFYYMQQPAMVNSLIHHGFNIEIPHRTLVSISSLMKVESTSKYWHWFDFQNWWNNDEFFKFFSMLFWIWIDVTSKLVAWRYGNQSDSPRRIHVDSTSILHWCVKDQISTNFHVISTYFFNVILLIENPRRFRVLFSMYFRWSKNPPCFQLLFRGYLHLSKNPRCFHVLFF